LFFNKNALLKICLLVIIGSYGTLISAAGLPPKAQRDVLIIKLAEHLKTDQWQQAYPLFAKIDAITKANKLKADASVAYYHGEVAFNLQKYAESKQYVIDYITRTGDKGSFYVKSLKLLAELDTKAEELYAKGNEYAYKKITKDPDGGPALRTSFTNAEPLWLEAAEMGHSGAMQKLGWIYRMGTTDGVKKDVNKALMWLRKSAALDNQDALNQLAKENLRGDIIPKNIEEGLRLYQKSAALGSGKAHIKLGELYGFLLASVYNYGKNDKDKALSWYLKVANYPESFEPKDVREAQNNIANSYGYGLVANIDGEQAIKWYTLAANEEQMKGKAFFGTLEASYSIEGRFQLGNIYLEGKYNTAKDLPRAFRLLQSIESNHLTAAYQLGKMYYEGAGVGKNDVEAEKLLRKAAANKCSHTSCWLNVESEKLLREMGLEP
jgi:TPR repeat protein